MKPENAIGVIALVIVGIILVRSFLPKEQGTEESAEENKVAYRYEIEDQNFTEINQNIVEPVDANVNVENVIDVSAIEELRSEAN